MKDTQTIINTKRCLPLLLPYYWLHCSVSFIKAEFISHLHFSILDLRRQQSSGQKIKNKSLISSAATSTKNH